MLGRKTGVFLGLTVASLSQESMAAFLLLLSCAEMPRCQGRREDSDSDSWAASDVTLRARSLKTSCCPCSDIPAVWTLARSLTHLTELYSNRLN